MGTNLTLAGIVSLFAMVAHTATVPLFPSQTHPSGQGFVRVINYSNWGGEVSIRATDESGMTVGPVKLSIGAGRTVHFNSEDLEVGNTGKGLSDGVGAGRGDWWLDVSSELNIEVIAYMRTDDGFLTSMYESVPGIGNRYRVPVFNPGSNRNQVSQLRLVNPNDQSVTVHIEGIDDGNAASEVSISLPGGLALSATAQELESGDPAGWPSGTEIEGALGDGTGKWQLILTASAPLIVTSLLKSPTGHLSNLSATPALVWRGLRIEPESRCPGNRYDRNEYGSRYRSKEDDIIEELGAIYGPYTDRCFESDRDTQIEHIVAINEAHHSGMCTADIETKRVFAGDLLNLTLAAPKINGAKSNLDAFDWLPEKNQCWFAQRVVDVKLKHGMTVDRDEAGALEGVLATCDSTRLVKVSCAD